MMQAASVEAKLDKPAVTAHRLEFLDALRGLAVLLVVIQHVCERYCQPLNWFTHTWISFGLAVPVFFLVSGFLIPYAMEKDGSVRSFWTKRIFRLYPLYWLSLALTVALGIEPADFFGPHFVRNVLVNVTMLQGFAGVPNASSPFWTLFIEMAFYLSFTLWFVLRVNRKSLLWAWVSVAAFVALSIVFPLLKSIHGPATRSFCFIAILAGTVFYRHLTGQVSAKALSILMGAVICVAGAGAYIDFYKFPRGETVSATATFLGWASAFVLFWVLFSHRARKFPGVLLWLGKISYSFYLLHAIVLDTMPNLRNDTLSFVAVMAISLTLSTISFQYVERPFVSLGHRLAKRMIRPQYTLNRTT